jgi:hypothetical protein
VEIRPLLNAYHTLLQSGTEQGIRQARDLLAQIERNQPHGNFDGERRLYEQALIQLGENRARERTRPEQEPVDDAILQRLEVRRQRERIIERSLQEIHFKHVQRLKSDRQYRMERLAQGPSRTPPNSHEFLQDRDLQVARHLRSQFQQALDTSNWTQAEALLQDLRNFDPSADLMPEYRSLKAAMEIGPQSRPTLAPTPVSRAVAQGQPPSSLGFQAAPTQHAPSTSSTSPAQQAAVESMLQNALGKLSQSGPEGEQMAQALSGFVASGGQDGARLQEALQSYRALQATAGSSGGPMSSLLENMLSQLATPSTQTSGADLGTMLGMLQHSGLVQPGTQASAPQASSSTQLQELQQMLSSLQQER